jgi:hypothetical protein
LLEAGPICLGSKMFFCIVQVGTPKFSQIRILFLNTTPKSVENIIQKIAAKFVLKNFYEKTTETKTTDGWNLEYYGLSYRREPGHMSCQIRLCSSILNETNLREKQENPASLSQGIAEIRHF